MINRTLVPLDPVKATTLVPGFDYQMIGRVSYRNKYNLFYVNMKEVWRHPLRDAR